MDNQEIAARRLQQQRIEGEKFARPEEVVAWLGAVQAQDYAGGLWAVGLRLAGATEADVERAIAERKIVRTWPMRRTLHLVPAEDVRWMLRLLTPRVVAGSTRRMHEYLGLDESSVKRAGKLFERALRGGKQLTRGAMYEVLERGGIPASEGRGLHLIARLAQDGLICFGPREGKQPTFALLDEWVPESKTLGREEALAELARRYFTSHGPATLQDFAWWSGLTGADARRGVELAGPHLASETAGGKTYWRSPSASGDGAAGVHLLPPFDEYIVAYRDRGAVLDPSRTRELNPGNGVFSSTIVSGGRVVGTWKRAAKKGSVVITPAPFAPLKRAEARALAEAARRYGEFVGLPAAVA